jgi:hypothetical protein
MLLETDWSEVLLHSLNKVNVCLYASSPKLLNQFLLNLDLEAYTKIHPQYLQLCKKLTQLHGTITVGTCRPIGLVQNTCLEHSVLDRCTTFVSYKADPSGRAV